MKGTCERCGKTTQLKGFTMRGVRGRFCVWCRWDLRRELLPAWYRGNQSRPPSEFESKKAIF